MARTGQQRLDAIPAAMARGEAFKARVKEATGDAVRCADLMAEAVDMEIEANGLEVVGHSGKATVCIESVVAAHCLIAARDEYRRARGSNLNPGEQVR